MNTFLSWLAIALLVALLVVAAVTIGLVIDLGADQLNSLGRV